MIQRLTQKPLQILLITYLILAGLYSVIDPIFEASDEQWHYPAVKTIADHGFQLPIQNPNVVTAWRQEGSQPPLYYLLGAALTFWIDTSDLDKARRINPHADIGIIIPDGNVNMVIHDPAVEAFPWRGTVLAVHLMRFFSVLLGAVTVWMTYWLALELFPDKRWLALASAAFTAFNPMFLFISGSVNNDNLSNAAGAALLVLIVRLLKRSEAPPVGDLILIGIVTGIGMLAKLNIGFLIPLLAVALLIVAVRIRDWRVFVVGGLVTGSLTVLIAGWWYLRNLQLYGDPTGLNMFLQIVGRRNVTPNLAQLWSERQTFLMSYWGLFGGVNVPMQAWVYNVFNGTAGLAVFGLLIGLVNWLGQRKRAINWTLLLGRAFTLLWIVVLFASLLRWTSETWASQGRLMFSAIAPISMWMAVGLWSFGRLRGPVLLVSVGLYFYFALFYALPVIYQTYSVSYQYNAGSWFHDLPDSIPPTADPSTGTVTFTEPGSEQTIQLKRLAAYYAPPVLGQYWNLPVAFFVPSGPGFRRDWSVSLHIENEQGVIVAQRDVYLHGGKAPTTLLPQGAGWINDFAILIPDFTHANSKVNVYLGLYDLKTGERMPVSGAGISVDRRVLIFSALLAERPQLPQVNEKIPNPMRINFGDQAELIGYGMPDLVLYPGKRVTVIFYWHALHPMAEDYRVFTQILNPGTTMTFGGDDAMPANWTRPTSSWKPGEVIKDSHTFKVNLDAVPGTWQIQVGMYRQTPDNQIKRLRLITPEGGEAENVALLTRVKIITPPEPF